MPCLWGTHNNSQIFLDIGIIDASSLPVPTPGMMGGRISPPNMFRALVDTGCQRTMISTSVVTKLGLNSLGKVPLQGIGSSVTYHNAYLFYAAFVVPIVASGQTLLPGTRVPAVAHVLPNPIYGGELTSSSGFDVLLGMDVLASGSLKIEGNGTFSFSF